MKRPRPPKGTGEHSWDEYHRKMAEYEAWQVEQRNRRTSNIAGPIVGAAFGITQAMSSPGLAGGAFPGQEVDAASFGNDWRTVSRQEQRDRQSRDLEDGARDSGNRTGWSSQGY